MPSLETSFFDRLNRRISPNAAVKVHLIFSLIGF